jgi:hypothetical protein
MKKVTRKKNNFNPSWALRRGFACYGQTLTFEPLDEGKFYFNLAYIVHGIRTRGFDHGVIENLIRTSGLCSSDESLLWAEVHNFCFNEGLMGQVFPDS